MSTKQDEIKALKLEVKRLKRELKEAIEGKNEHWIFLTEMTRAVKAMMVHNKIKRVVTSEESLLASDGYGINLTQNKTRLTDEERASFGHLPGLRILECLPPGMTPQSQVPLSQPSR